MRPFRYRIGPEHAGITVETYLRRVCGYSSRVLVKLKHYPDGLTLNGEHIRTVDRLSEGDLLGVNFRSFESTILATDLCVPVLYEDADVLVFAKPADMPVHPAKKNQENTLGNHYAWIMEERNEPAVFRPVNRLDRDTSGACVVAKHQHAASLLNGKVQKSYLALVCGITPPSGTVDAPIARRDDFDILRMVSPLGQSAVTHYRALGVGGGCTLLRLWLETGRTHQIRVHMSHIGHPLEGDLRYGGRPDLLTRQALHCEQVTFSRVEDGSCVTVQAPLPQDFIAALQQCGIPIPTPEAGTEEKR